MELSLKPHQLVAHWVPGFATLGLLYLDCAHGRYGYLKRLSDILPNGDVLGTALAILMFAAGALLVGHFLDSLRDMAEYLLDLKWPVRWDKLIKMEESERQAWSDFYFTYYVEGANLALGGVGTLGFHAIAVLLHPTCSQVFLGGIALGILVFAGDALLLRHEMRKLLETVTHGKDERASKGAGRCSPTGELGES
jgi:hypothetical protein